MRKNKKEGLQFSFGLKPEQENYSSKSTPKFPSIQISKSHLSTSMDKKTNQFNGETDPIQPRKHTSDLFLEIGGGIELLQKKTGTKQKIINDPIPHFPLNDNLSVDSRDNKSVKSTKSLGERFIKRTNRIVVQRSIKTNKKHSNSLANILELKIQSPKKEGRNFFGFKHSQPPLSRAASQPKHEKKNANQDTLKLQSKQLRNDTTNIEFRQTKKKNQTFQRSKVGEAEVGTSKIFKNFVHKARPALRLTQRVMNNQKIESITRLFQDKSI